MEVSSGTTVWNDCLEVIRENVGEENFNTWFKPIAPLRVDATVRGRSRRGARAPGRRE